MSILINHKKRKKRVKFFFDSCFVFFLKINIVLQNRHKKAPPIRY